MPSDAARESVEGMCMLFHTSVRTLAQDFLTQLQRHYYATPTSYLELISTYKQLLAAKRTQVYTLKHRWVSSQPAFLCMKHRRFSCTQLLAWFCRMLHQ